ncbi:MAG: VOC family protein [Bdellovibrionota bacterium]
MKRLAHVAVFVSDIDRSRKFYEEVLGLRHSETHPPEDHFMNKAMGHTLCFLSCGNVHHDIVLVQQKDPKTGGAVPVGGHQLAHYAFELGPDESPEAFAKRLRDKKIPILYGPILHDPGPGGDGSWGGNRSVYFRDPDGHVVEVYSGMDTFVENRAR